MVAIISPLSAKLVDTIAGDFPAYKLVESDIFCWSPLKKSICYIPGASARDLLHELAHAVLGHTEYVLDVELLQQESEAWTYAQQTLGPKYKTVFSARHIQYSLDSYREWLHLRSQCPGCSQTGIQHKTSTYSCINCGCSWHANDARQCALRRYKLT